MKAPPVKQHWLDRAIDVHNFHVQMCRDNLSWSMVKTAETLNRSIGSVSEDIKIASWVRSHEKNLRRCDSQREALRFIREKERELKMREI